jgi:hypothetical protein
MFASIVTDALVPDLIIPQLNEQLARVSESEAQCLHRAE